MPGDYAKLTAWEKKIARIKDPVQRALHKTARDYRIDISANFDKSVSPYGEAWKARRRKYPHKPLLQTSKMRHGWRVKVQGETIIFVNVDGRGIAKFHQDGTRFMVARPAAPNKRGLPDRYSDMLRNNMVTEISRDLGAMLGAG